MKKPPPVARAREIVAWLKARAGRRIRRMYLVERSSLPEVGAFLTFCVQCVDIKLHFGQKDRGVKCSKCGRAIFKGRVPDRMWMDLMAENEAFGKFHRCLRQRVSQ